MHPRWGALAIAAALSGAPNLGAAQSLCDNPAKACGDLIEQNCLLRVGAGAIEVGDDCATQFTAYQGCLAKAAEECSGPTAGGAQDCAPEDARLLYADLDKEDPAALRAFIEICPGSPPARLAAFKLEQLAPATPDAPAPAPAPPAAPVFPTEADVRAAQTELQRLGYYTSRIDGDWGPGSRRALAAYQRDFRVRDTGGQLTEAVLAALRIAERKPAPPASPLSSATTSASTSGGRQPGETFRDCPNCPEMVSIPGGSFTMGSPASEPDRDDDEGPQRTVRVQPFAMGKFEVTFAEWDACVSAGGCSHRPDDRGWGRGRRPVINVSWNDAQEYVGWLNRQVSGSPYRLPSEAEWEYAARAGTTTPYSSGNSITERQANFGRNIRRTTDVGTYGANPFGLYDVHGNVWEWVQDCWNGSYSGAPTNGSAWISGDCSRAVLRGGSWFITPRNLRSANRVRNLRDYRDGGYGFRVARTLNR